MNKFLLSLLLNSSLLITSVSAMDIDGPSDWNMGEGNRIVHPDRTMKDENISGPSDRRMRDVNMNTDAYMSYVKQDTPMRNVKQDTSMQNTRGDTKMSKRNFKTDSSDEFNMIDVDMSDSQDLTLSR